MNLKRTKCYNSLWDELANSKFEKRVCWFSSSLEREFADVGSFMAFSVNSCCKTSFWALGTLLQPEPFSCCSSPITYQINDNDNNDNDNDNDHDD